MNHDKSFYMTLVSNGSQTLYPGNTIAAFTTELARAIELNPDFRWEVALCEFSCPAASAGSRDGDFIGLIYCDLISPQTIGSTFARCLRTFTYTLNEPCEFIFANSYYVPVESTSFKNIRIEILTLSGERVTFESGATPSRLVLHFRPHHVWA
jgi:hypothetical protein